MHGLVAEPLELRSDSSVETGLDVLQRREQEPHAGRIIDCGTVIVRRVPSTPPRIVVDLRLVDRPEMEHGGVGRYALEVARALRRARSRWDLLVLSNRRDLVGSMAPRPTRWPTGTTFGRVAWLHAGSALSRATRRADLWFSPGFVVPVWWRRPSVVTVHDLTFALEGGRYRGRLNALHALHATRRSARRARRVLCGSRQTADLLQRHLGVDPGRVAVTPYGVAEPFLRQPVCDPAARDRFLLFVGVLEARKGLETLLPAFRALDGAVELVLAGRPGWGTEQVLAELRREPRVRFEQSPSDERLAELYRRALALVYPSRMEGFGLPVAEAMASGCPVVASELACIREFAGDVPLYAAPGDAAALAERLERLLGDPSLQAQRSREGVRAAARLSWDEVGERTAQAIEDALGEEGAPARGYPATSA
jgi:glycosyltransferase involved in cell wall biosynthesis